MYRIGVTAFLVAAQLAHGFVIERKGDLLRRAEGDTDHPDETVVLAACTKYQKGYLQPTSLEDIVLYYDEYNYIPGNTSAIAADKATPSFSKSQMGTHLDWTASKQDDKISAKFEKLGKTFTVWDLSDKGDANTNRTGTADLGGTGMLCYKDARAFTMDQDNWHWTCNAPYFCTRGSREIKRTVFDVYTTTIDVGVLALSPEKTPDNRTDNRVQSVVGNAFYLLQLADQNNVGAAYEYAIDPQFQKQTIRFDLQAGEHQGDSKYDEEQVRAISNWLFDLMTPVLVNEARRGDCKFGAQSDNPYNCIYYIPFPTQIRVQVQHALQDKLDWKSTDVIDIYVESDDKKDCKDGTPLARTLSRAFTGLTTVMTGGYSAAASVLGDIYGNYQTGTCP